MVEKALYGIVASHDDFETERGSEEPAAKEGTTKGSFSMIKYACGMLGQLISNKANDSITPKSERPSFVLSE